MISFSNVKSYSRLLNSIMTNSEGKINNLMPEYFNSKNRIYPNANHMRRSSKIYLIKNKCSSKIKPSKKIFKNYGEC